VPSLRLDLAFLLLTLAANFAASWIAAYPNGATFTMQSRQAERDAAAPKYQKREVVLRGEEERGVGGGQGVVVCGDVTARARGILRCADSAWSDVAFPKRQAEEQPLRSGTVEEWAR
jgi:hypothetical protein